MLTDVLDCATMTWLISWAYRPKSSGSCAPSLRSIGYSQCTRPCDCCFRSKLTAEDRHNRQETREGMQRPISRTYYYIDFRQTLDAIKFRIYRVTKEVESLIRPTDERKDYFCPRCKSRWTQLEVLDYIGPEGFYCHKCDGPLDRDDESIGDRGGHEMQSKLMKQLEPLLVLLPRIDGVVIPEYGHELLAVEPTHG